MFAKNGKKMKRCRSCDFCRKDLVSEYIKGVDFYTCDMTDEPILDPRGEGKTCAYYQKDSFGVGGFRKWLADWLHC